MLAVRRRRFPVMGAGGEIHWPSVTGRGVFVFDSEISSISCSIFSPLTYGFSESRGT